MTAARPDRSDANPLSDIDIPPVATADGRLHEMRHRAVLSISMQPGEVHTLMGPNGCAGMTLPNTPMSSPEHVTSELGVLAITHHQRFLGFLTADDVPGMVEQLEHEGFDARLEPA